MLGTGLGFGELGGVRIVVMEKRTFIKEMADYIDDDIGDKDHDDEEDNEMGEGSVRGGEMRLTCFSVEEQAAVWWVLSVM